MKRTSRRPTPPDTTATGLTLAAFLPYRLNVAAAAVSDGLARIYGERFGIGIAEWRILATLGEFDTLTATAIGAHARMGKVKVSRAAALLEVRGLIQRSRNGDDRREAFLSLTATGRAMYEEIVPLAQGYAARLFENFTPTERATLERALDRLMGTSRS